MMKKLIVLFSLLLLLGSCTNESDPQTPETPETPEQPETPEKPTITPELKQKIEALNVALVTLTGFVASADASPVKAMSETVDGTRLVFRNGESVTIACDAASVQAPLIGLAADGEVYYWTLASQTGRPWLLDAAGERMPLSGPVPVAGVDDEGFWTVTTAENTAAWRIKDAAGEPVAATGEEAVTLFRSVTQERGSVRVALTCEVSLNADWIDNLSAAGTANSYIVSTAGSYCFSAAVRGNGLGDAAASGLDPAIEPADAMTADWLWTSSADLVSEVSYDKILGEIAFTAGSGRGNAVIALMLGGEVVWSWHIWMTDAPQTMTYENGVIFMDRNLGATGVTVGGTDAYGMYYQWGRKDPFYGGEKTETSAEAFLQAKANTTFNPAYADLTWNFNGVATTPLEAAKHPTTFYNAKVGTTYNWLAKPLTKMWDVEKNLNDPCPAGYRVAEIDAWQNLSAGNDYIGGVSAWDNTNFGMTYTYNGQTAWYPAQGYRNYSSGSIVGLRSSTGGSGTYWSTTTSAAKTRYLFFKKQLTSSSGSINPELDKERSYGYTVRCCRE